MKGLRHLPWYVALPLTCVFLICVRCVAQEYQDGPPVSPATQGVFNNWYTHVCPVGYAMAGALVSDNRFLCLRVVPASGEAGVQTYLDTDTQGTVGGVTMHVCKAGWYMRGYHQINNWLVCSQSPLVQVNPSFLDPAQNYGPTEDYGMHVCGILHGKRAVMTGILDSSNHFSCAEPK